VLLGRCHMALVGGSYRRGFPAAPSRKAGYHKDHKAVGEDRREYSRAEDHTLEGACCKEGWRGSPLDEVASKNLKHVDAH
jgi:hypothetical protein